jgi:hypothetical protein
MKVLRLLSALSLLFSYFSFRNDAAAQTAPSISASDKTGSICVLPNSPDPPTRISPGGDYNPDTLTLRIDGRRAIPWPHKEPVLIDGLDLQERHLVVLTSDGKRIKSFRFRFAEQQDARRCIYFDGYQGVQFETPTIAPWCRVKTKSCWR